MNRFERRKWRHAELGSKRGEDRNDANATNFRERKV